MNEEKRTGIPFYIMCAVILAAMFGLGFYFSSDTPEPLAGADSPYSYGNASSTTFTDSKIYQLKTGQTILGSVTIASSSVVSFKLKNATSSTDISSTTITVFPAAADEATYNFDTAISRGLIIESSSGFNGDIVIMYK